MGKKTMGWLFSCAVITLWCGSIIGIFHFGNNLFGADNATMSLATDNRALSFVQASISQIGCLVWDELCSSVHSIGRQTLGNLHQTIALIIVFWLIGASKRTWVNNVAPKLNDVVDTYFANTNLQTRQAIKEYMNLLVSNSIDTVEASFMYAHANITGNEDAVAQAQATKERNQTKMSAAISLVMEDLIRNGIKELAAHNHDDNALLLEIANMIEQEIMKKKLKIADLDNAGQDDSPKAIIPVNEQIGLNNKQAINIPTDAIWNTAARIKVSPSTINAQMHAHANRLMQTSFKIINGADKRLEDKYRVMIKTVVGSLHS